MQPLVRTSRAQKRRAEILSTSLKVALGVASRLEIWSSVHLGASLSNNGDDNMKTTIALAAALLSLGIAGTTPATAFHLSPAGPFTADGDTSATKNGITLPCKAHFTGTVASNGIAHITGGSFTDNGAQGCTLVTLNGLPWKVKAVKKAKVKIFNVAFSTPIGDCGPGTMPALLKQGALSFTAVPLQPNCSISGNVTTSPTISIVP